LVEVHRLDLQSITVQASPGIGTVRHHLTQVFEKDRRAQPGSAGGAAAQLHRADKLVERRSGHAYALRYKPATNEVGCFPPLGGL